jgi:ATP-binding cassette subfamily B protein
MERDVNRYRQLLGYAVPYRRGWALIFLVSLFGAGFALLQPWPMQFLADQILGSVPIPAPLAAIFAVLPGAETPHVFLVYVVMAGLVIFAVNSVVDVVMTIGWIRVGQQMVYDLARDLFANIQRRSLVFHSRNAVGDSLSRIMGDSWCVNSIVDSLLLTPLHALFLIAGMTLIMFRMDQTLALLALTAAPFMAVASFYLAKPIRTAARRGRETQSRIQAHVQQTLSGIPVVQAFAQEDREHSRFLEYAGAAIQAQQRVTLLSSTYNLGSGLLIAVGTALVLWVGAQRVTAGELTLGYLLVFLGYLNSLQAQIKKLATIYETLQKTNAGMDRVMEVLDVAPEIADKPGAVELEKVRGHIELRHVSFGHESGRPVLRDVSLEIKPGETVAVVGPTGAGKSTLAGMVARFFDPWEGEVVIDGRDIRDVAMRSLRRQIALVLQEPFLFRTTIAGNIALGRPDARRDEIEAAARDAGAHGFIERLPAGYDTLLGDRGATLSGGERQRLSIARALLMDAPILILDEPTSALDARTEAQLLEALERLMRGRTTLIIGHRLSTVRDADCIVVLKDGSIVESGKHDELLERAGHYARLHRAQFREAAHDAAE